MKIKHQFLVLLISLTSGWQAFAQSNDKTSSEDNVNLIISSSKPYSLYQENSSLNESLLSFQKTDTVPASQSVGEILPGAYIEKMDKYQIAKLSFINDNERFSLDQGNQDLQIYPNGEAKIHLNLNYRFISVGINYLPKFISSNDDDDLKGKTKAFGLSTAFNFQNWFQMVSYNQTRGYYLENTHDFENDWKKGDPYIQFPDLLYRNFQGTTGYSFNSNFSTKSLLTGTERQLKSAGSFIPTLMYRYYLVDNRETLTQFNSTQKSNNFQVIASAGYYYNLIIKQNFYISGGASAGYGILASKVTTRTINEQVKSKQTEGVFHYDLRAAAGYNGERFFSGFVFTTERNTYRQANTTVINENWRVFAEVFVGYRFHAPKFLENMVDKLPIQ
ncbi:DUF4421 domain-containing protein [Algoriphagus chordae]|uniref:Uncharacterized protein DUF4421 n=1 Tax=Algoriphagus chordae TaxID=237019 RepID=A0A2W7QS79_9BACT|nr:DUF4421 domain-containing protein [Algoriphagus chordae]PZX51423.1 uncharacterized protein DUF4421 [Algoriphagus chordae]